jgi:hypothetical protein
MVAASVMEALNLNYNSIRIQKRNKQKMRSHWLRTYIIQI